MGEVARTGAESLVDHHGFLKAYFTRHLKSNQDAEDCVHEVYSRVLASAETAGAVKNWRALLVTVAKSVVVDQFRRDAARRRDQHLPLDDDLDLLHDPQPDPESAVSARQRLAAAEKVLAELDPVCRQVFLLARVDGLSHKEIAKRLGIAQISVGRHVQQALYALARRGGNDSGS
jgi:RNA polymerase sigma-70 factor (ECF subfamily)